MRAAQAGFPLLIVCATWCSAGEPIADSAVAASTTAALAALRALPLAEPVIATVRQRSLRPGDTDPADATVLDGTIVLDHPRWSLRLTDPERPGWLLLLRGDAFGWEERERLAADDPAPTVTAHAPGADDRHQRRFAALVRRDLDALAQEFRISATAVPAVGFELRLVPLQQALRRDWLRADLLIDPRGLVQRVVVDEAAGTQRSIQVLSATTGATIDPSLFAGIARVRR